VKALPILILGGIFAAGALIACSEPAPTQSSAGKAASSAAPAAAAAGGDGGVGMTAPKMEFSENDFAESDRNRDPFRTYLTSLAPSEKKPTTIQRNITLPEYSLDELRLVAIVTGGDYPRAMVVDPNGKGWVIKRGDWVGRPETVHIGGANGADYSLNWRVDKVRDGDIVFVREDPAQPGIPPATRVVALRPDNDDARQKL
jgi:type IV pilus assembly protein PilP